MKMSVWRIAPEKNVKGHPCPFPVEIPLRCVDSSCPPSGVVLDPFMGSGTTLIACQRLGRLGIGIEKETKYFELSCKRLEEEMKQGSLLEGVA